MLAFLSVFLIGFLAGFAYALISKRVARDKEAVREEGFQRGYTHGWLDRHGRNEMNHEWARREFSDNAIHDFNEQMKSNLLPPGV